MQNTSCQAKKFINIANSSVFRSTVKTNEVINNIQYNLIIVFHLIFNSFQTAQYFSKNEDNIYVYEIKTNGKLFSRKRSKNVIKCAI